MDINTIAKMAGVSRATVSRYLNDGYVSEEKRRLIKRVIDQTGYVPSPQAQTLRTGKTRLVGVIIPKINSHSVSRMVAGLSVVFNEAGYQMLLANTDNDAKEEIRFLQLFAERSQVDGVVLISTIITPAHQRALDALKVPLVVLGQQMEGRSCVFQDDYRATLEITRLVAEKSAHPAFIGVREDDLSAGCHRHQGFLAACREAGLNVPDRAQVIGGFDVDSGYTSCEGLLEAYPEVDAVVCATDSVAYGALTCLREYGHGVPDEVQVTGIGDGTLSQIISPSLTTVHNYYKTSGIEAAKMLVAAMADVSDNVARQIMMGFELRRRRSTR